MHQCIGLPFKWAILQVLSVIVSPSSCNPSGAAKLTILLQWDYAARKSLSNHILACQLSVGGFVPAITQLMHSYIVSYRTHGLCGWCAYYLLWCFQQSIHTKRAIKSSCRDLKSKCGMTLFQFHCDLINMKPQFHYDEVTMELWLH